MEDSEYKKKVNAVFYKTSAQAVGRRANEGLNPPAHGKNGCFSKHLLNSGMWKNNGLNCRVDTDRYLDGSKDWMDKIN
jgi:hypothetical protein